VITTNLQPAVRFTASDHTLGEDIPQFELDAGLTRVCGDRS
jgi:hypothetical protein